jgi:hypothetical protein
VVIGYDITICGEDHARTTAYLRLRRPAAEEKVLPAGVRHTTLVDTVDVDYTWNHLRGCSGEVKIFKTNGVCSGHHRGLVIGSFVVGGKLIVIAGRLWLLLNLHLVESIGTSQSGQESNYNDFQCISHVR